MALGTDDPSVLEALPLTHLDELARARDSARVSSTNASHRPWRGPAKPVSRGARSLRSCAATSRSYPSPRCPRVGARIRQDTPTGPVPWGCTCFRFHKNSSWRARPGDCGRPLPCLAVVLTQLESSDGYPALLLEVAGSSPRRRQDITASFPEIATRPLGVDSQATVAISGNEAVMSCLCRDWIRQSVVHEQQGAVAVELSARRHNRRAGRRMAEFAGPSAPGRVLVETEAHAPPGDWSSGSG